MPTLAALCSLLTSLQNSVDSQPHWPVLSALLLLAPLSTMPSAPRTGVTSLTPRPRWCPFSMTPCSDILSHVWNHCCTGDSWKIEMSSLAFNKGLINVCWIERTVWCLTLKKRWKSKDNKRNSCKNLEKQGKARLWTSLHFRLLARDLGLVQMQSLF